MSDHTFCLSPRGLGFLAAMLLVLAWPSLGHAHRVNLFAYVDGGSVVADCFYSKSRKVNAGQVIVSDAVTGQELLRGTTDDQGGFTFAVPEAARAAGHGLKLLLIAGEGHQNEWLVEASEFGSVAPPAPAPAAPTAEATAVATASEGAVTVDAQALGLIVEQAVDRKLAPLKRMLMEAGEAGPGLTEILGGIGWIFGLFGVAALVASRRRSG